MRTLLILSLLLPAAAATAQTARPARSLAPPCATANGQQADAKREGRPRKLGEMPMAQPFYAVVREVDGCFRTVSVRSEQARRR